MFNKSLIAAFAATAVSSFASVAQADALSSTSAVGAIYIGATQMLSIDARATAYVFSNPALAPQFSGNVYITGYSGDFGVSISAPVTNVTFGQTPISGVNYPTAHLSTAKFFFVNLTTRQKTLATAEVDIVKYGARGMVCFQVTSVADGSTLAMTCDNMGNVIDLPLTTGSATLKTPPVAAPALKTAPSLASAKASLSGSSEIRGVVAKTP